MRYVLRKPVAKLEKNREFTYMLKLRELIYRRIGDDYR